MKETIYTIPINEAYDIKTGCPLCTLYNKLEHASVEYITGAAMMETDVRISTNLSGFCRKHYKLMAGQNKKLSLALILESHLAELIDECFLPDTGSLSKKELDRILTRLDKTADGCFVCDRINAHMDKYYRNIIYLWRKDADFREKTGKQDYFCLKHLSKLFEIGKASLGKSYPEFFGQHMRVTEKKLSTLKRDISKFCKSFDYRFSDMPLDEAKNAVENAVEFLSL